MLGFVLRQQLVHEVRNEYESIVDGIQSKELLQKLPLPLSNEAIKWPHENKLCLPLFIIQKRDSLRESCHDDQDKLTHYTPSHHIESCEQERDDLDTQYRGEDIPISTPNLSPQLVRGEVGSNTGDSHQAGDDDEQLVHDKVDVCSLECLIERLPRDREALLELRSQLSLELLWVKQAIASRQEVSFKFNRIAEN